jgi:hypothetical protein
LLAISAKEPILASIGTFAFAEKRGQCNGKLIITICFLLILKLLYFYKKASTIHTNLLLNHEEPLLHYPLLTNFISDANNSLELFLQW